jgi:hypothetical protein
MRTLVNAFRQLPFLNMLWLLLLAFILHELEEWNIAQFERRNFVGVPPTVTDRSARTWIVFICMVGVAWCTVATLPGNPTIAAYIFLPAIIVTFLNAVQHVYWSAYFRQYAPGVITSGFLLIPLNAYVIIRAIQQRYVSIWYIAVLAVIFVLGLINTVQTGKKTPHVVHIVYNIGFKLSEKLLK